ncbi:MAG: ParB/RepB/Spo0J family partition protein [Minisyncoccia bacterium]
MIDGFDVGQGVNALIPKKKATPSSFGLEEKIEGKVNDSITNYPSDLKTENFKNNEEKNHSSLETLTNDFQKDFKVEKEKEKKELNNKIEEEKFLFTDSKKEEKIFYIETDKIKPNPLQPRKEFSEESIKELAESIREYGILEPLIVSRIEKETFSGTEVEYQLIAGERRWRAAKLLNLPTVPVIIKKSIPEENHLEIALIENIQREDLNIMHKARAFQKLIIDYGLTQQALALKLGKSREVVANTLRLLQLPFEAQKYLEEGKINEGHARAILLFSNPEKRRLFLKEILAKNLSGREAMELAQHYLNSSLESKRSLKNRLKENNLEPETLELKEKLENYFGMPVKIKKAGDKGAIEVMFFSENDFYRIINKLLNKKEESAK